MLQQKSRKTPNGNLDIMSFPCGYVLHVQAVFGYMKEKTDVLFHILKMCLDEHLLGSVFFVNFTFKSFKHWYRQILPDYNTSSMNIEVDN